MYIVVLVPVFCDNGIASKKLKDLTMRKIPLIGLLNSREHVAIL